MSDLIGRLIRALRTQRRIDADGCEVAVSREAYDKAAAELERLTAENEALRADAGRWQKMRRLMMHQHSGPIIGWTLDVLLPGDDPDAAIDDARAKETGDG